MLAANAVGQSHHRWLTQGIRVRARSYSLNYTPVRGAAGQYQNPRLSRITA